MVMVSKCCGLTIFIFLLQLYHNLKVLERWLSGRKRHTANVLCSFKTASRVQIPASPHKQTSRLNRDVCDLKIVTEVVY